MSAVLADTGPLYALADPSDQYHRRAQGDLKRLEAAGAYVATVYPTVAEAYTLVLRRLGGSYAHAWLQEVLEGVMAINPEPGDYHAAAVRIWDYVDQPITLFDAVLAAVSTRLKIPVWTYDQHFEWMRVVCWREPFGFLARGCGLPYSAETAAPASVLLSFCIRLAAVKGF